MPIYCEFCGWTAKYVAPQYHGGDIDGKTEWKAVCQNHLNNWYRNIPEKHMISYFTINEEQHLAMDRAVLDEYGKVE